ncbi:DUF5994 family protein [Nocardia sp. NPDC005366]|uniref:DUF5994 family protein n=1 Tax=Nocardia sp. NPDC005366 TaxID=3156878 RepID=UPI0033A5AA05
MIDIHPRRPITNHREMGESAGAPRSPEQPFRTPTRTPRLLLCGADTGSDGVDGAWWPWTDNLTAELHDLVSALVPRLGPVARIGFDWNAVSVSQRHIDRADGIEIVGPGLGQAPDTMQLFGADASHLTLLVIPAHTPPDEAYDRMRRASGDASSDLSGE